MRSESQLRAYRAVDRALKAGTLVRPDACERCGRVPGKPRPAAHHYLGYDEEHWLDVQWLCHRCHNEVHAGAAGGNATAITLSAEERSAVALQAWEIKRARYTSEEISTQMQRGWAELTPEQRTEHAQKGWATLTPEQRSRRGRKSAASRSPEQDRRANRRMNCVRWHGPDCGCWAEAG